MNLSEAFVIAGRGLKANKLRSVLTTLGIIIGVAAVIVLVGLGDGIKAGFSDTFGKTANQVTVSKVSGTVLGGASRNLTDSDVKALAQHSTTPDVASATPVVTGSALATYAQKQYQTSVVGSTSDYLGVANRDLLVGQMFTAAQQNANARVVVLGVNPVATLFGGDAAAALGQQVRIGRSNFTVIGVLTSDRQGDDDVVMPLGAARAYLVGGGDAVNQIIVKAASTNQVTAAETEIETVLDDQHHIKDPSERDFTVHSFQNQLQDMQQTMTFLEIFIIAIAGISLVVGGIGVANIMLVSVTERTREIGIRKAIGARGSAIMKQFLIESTVLAGLGGAVGVVFGVGLTLVAAAVIPTLAPKFGTPDVSTLAVVASFVFSLFIGVLAGGYPARRASRLRPIEALRFE